MECRGRAVWCVGLAALVSLSKTLSHTCNCFVLQMGRKAVGPVCCVNARKRTQDTYHKREGACPGVSGLAANAPKSMFRVYMYRVMRIWTYYRWNLRNINAIYYYIYVTSFPVWIKERVIFPEFHVRINMKIWNAFLTGFFWRHDVISWNFYSLVA